MHADRDIESEANRNTSGVAEIGGDSNPSSDSDDDTIPAINHTVTFKLESNV